MKRVMLAVVLAVVCAAAVARADGDDAQAIRDAAPHCEADRAHCFAIRLHVARGDDGLVVTPQWIAAQVANANKQFARIDASFQLASVDLESVARVEDRAARDAFAPKVGGTVIDVFVTGYLGDVDKPGAFIRGVTWRTKTERKYIILSAVGVERTLAHELGHFFGLPHSTYKVSIMNKTSREDPPPEERRFADEEIEKMKPVLVRLVKDGVVADVKPAS